MGEYTPEEFDRLVAALRPTTPAKACKKRKADCSPQEWAGKLEWCRHWSETHPEKNRASKRKYRDRNREKHNAKTRRWQSANKDKVRESQRKWRASNLERVLARRRSRYAENSGEILERARNWRANNAEKDREIKRQWHKDAYKNDENFKLSKILRSRLAAAMRSSPKSLSAVRDLGCTIAELWLHLESKFQPGMTRENMGTAWHLDHIYPMAKANLQDRSQLLAVNNWRNLQPLTPEENKSKKDKITPEAQKLFDQLCLEFA